MGRDGWEGKGRGGKGSHTPNTIFYARIACGANLFIIESLNRKFGQAVSKLSPSRAKRVPRLTKQIVDYGETQPFSFFFSTHLRPKTGACRFAREAKLARDLVQVKAERRRKWKLAMEELELISRTLICFCNAEIVAYNMVKSPSGHGW